MGALTRLTVLLLLPASVSAQERRCQGSDPEAAERARSRATALLEANLGRSRVNVAALRDAAREASVACDAGDPRGLFQRAVARDALAEFDLAARDLDAFLRRDPARASDDFVRGLRERLAPRVARVGVIRSGGEVMRVQIDGTTLDADERALAVLPGERRVRVEVEGFLPAELTVRAPAGALVAVAVRRDDEAPRPAPEVVLRRVPVRSEVDPQPAPPVAPHPLRPWALGGSIAAGATLALGLGMLVWRTSSASTYSGLGCEAMTAPSNACLDTYAQFRDANAATVATLVSAGVLAAVAGTLWYLELRRPSTRALRCAPGVLGAGCVMRF